MNVNITHGFQRHNEVCRKATKEFKSSQEEARRVKFIVNHKKILIIFSSPGTNKSMLKPSPYACGIRTESLNWNQIINLSISPSKNKTKQKKHPGFVILNHHALYFRLPLFYFPGKKKKCK